MKIGNLEVIFHRTVRVPDGRTPANLPPSLGRIEAYQVSKFRENCPESWEDGGVFIPLHDMEALWMSFDSPHPLAVIVGAGNVNAVNGEKLGTNLVKDGYLVVPPQPWLDGWKDTDGTIYQFVATPYKKGDGLSVGEQLLKQDSKTGGIGIAIFEPKDREKLESVSKPKEHYGESMYDTLSYFGQSVKMGAEPKMRGGSFTEMGLGKGGKIVQKIYPDPHGIEAWQEKPSATMAIYLVNAKTFAEITGLPEPPMPIGHKNYKSAWFGLSDNEMQDVQGSNSFVGLKSVFLEENVTQQK